MKLSSVSAIAAAAAVLALAAGASPAQAAPPERPLAAYCDLTGGYAGVTSVPFGTRSVDYYWSSITVSEKGRKRAPTSAWPGIGASDYIYVTALDADGHVLAQDLRVYCLA